MIPTGLTLDHAVLDVGPHFDRTVGALSAAGFNVSPASSHKGMRNRRIYFDSTYLTLLQKLGEAEAAPTPEASGGVIAVAFKGRELEAMAQRWQVAGKAAREVVEMSREVVLDGAPQTARFRTLDLPEDSLGAIHAFVCYHLTPELLWRPEWQTHGNGATDLVGIVVAAADPEAEARKLARDLAAGEPLMTADGLKVSGVFFQPHGEGAVTAKPAPACVAAALLVAARPKAASRLPAYRSGSC
ncbi:VOC family protein [Chelatococcus sp. GCM10030263]|uniref:VOC family protein n=1 Tax=Chelatococcus sp. GCM10030263 TaxID=3273387 RepID=UPI00361B8BCA